MKKNLTTVFLFFFILLAIFYDNARLIALNSVNTIEIPVIIWKKSVIYDELLRGFQYESGYKLDNPEQFDVKFKYYTVNENTSKSIELFKSLNNPSNRFIVLIGTGLAIRILKSEDFKPKTKLVFVGVNNLRADSEFASILTKFRKDIITLTYYQKFEEKINAFAKLFFKPSKIGVLYNPENEASIFEIPDIRQYCKSHNLQLIEYPITNKNDVIGFKKKLAELRKKIMGIDLLIVNSGTELTLNLEALVTAEFKIPVLVYQKEGLEHNGLFTIWANQFYSGVYLYECIIDILSGRRLFFEMQPIPDAQNKYRLFVNPSQVKRLNLRFPAQYVSILNGVK